MSNDLAAADFNGSGNPRALRYFACRGRGEALRLALVDSGVAFHDERVPIQDLSAFQKTKHDPRIGGPFAGLPVLLWDGLELAQTLPIANYLSLQLGHDRRASSPAARAFLEMITSAAHLDMQVPYGPLFWSPAGQSDEQLFAAARLLFNGLCAKLGQLESLFGRSGSDGAYFGGAEPAIADYFVHESLGRGAAVFGAAFEARLAATPRLAALRLALGARPAIAAYERAGKVPLQATGSPNEMALRARLTGLAL